MTLTEAEEDAIAKFESIYLSEMTGIQTKPIQSTVSDGQERLCPADTLYRENVMTGIQLSRTKCTVKCHTRTISFEICQ